MSRAKLTRDYSGVVIDQSAAPASPDDTLEASSDLVYQEFVLPDDYRRGSEAGEVRWPALSGFQVLVTIADGWATQATLDWRVDRLALGGGWIPMTAGTTIGAHADGRVWMDVYFDDPLPVTSDTVTDRYRIGVGGRVDVGVTPVRDVPVESYDGSIASVEGVAVSARLRDGIPYAFDLDGVPSFLLHDASENETTYSTQWGVENFWYSTPNPLANIGNGRALRPEAVPVDDGGDVSLLFRVLALSADEGVDFLGNPYRSSVVWGSASNTATTDGGLRDKFYASDPCPSKFGVKSLYFDNRGVNDEATTFDRVLLDPITPDVYFHVYFSDDGVEPHPGMTEEEWEDRLWRPVPKTFQMRQRTTHAMPKPVTAKYVKVECSHLQAQAYAPGGFNRPVTYKKHPKWVLDYFLARTETTSAQDLTSRTTALVYDALDLAYNYYRDDLHEAPDEPETVAAADAGSILAYLHQRDDVSDQIDVTTLNQINLEMAPWAQNLRFRARYDYLPSTIVTPDDNQPSEIVTSTASLPFSSAATEQIVFEKTFPVMYFFVDCRHFYREVSASFTQNRAYFVAIREIAFLRDRYTIAHDGDLYVESAGDNVNVALNDFTRTDDGIWAVYDG